MRCGILVLAAVGVALSTEARAQGRITGTVTAAQDGRAIAGATVTVVGTNRTAATEASGRYEIADAPSGTQLVRVRLLGFAPLTLTVQVPAGEAVTLDFQLVAAAVQLEGVVVVGYGTQERRDLTGAIASVSAEQIAEVPTPNPMQAIQARTPGVDDVAGGSYRPGVPMNVTVRGVRSIAAGNQPLYVVDGVPLAGGIEDFNPAIIQSIEVLKDASATAVYGSRGSNGVILITTRRGAAGAADNSIHVSYDAQYGGQSALHLVDMMNGPQAIAERREAARSAGRPTNDASVFTPDELPQVQCATDAAYQAAHPGCATGTDWQRLVLRTGYQQRHQLGITSVAGNSRLSLTGSYFDQDGITLGQGYRQYSGTVSFENTYRRLRIGVTATGTRSIADIGADASVWCEALANNPLGLPYDSAGVPSATLCSVCTLKIKPTPDPLRVNPLRQAEGFVRQQTRNRLFGSVFAELELGRGFSYRVNFGPDLGNRMDGQFQGANVVLNQTPIGNAQAQRTDAEEFAYTLDQLLLWNRTAGNHRFDVTLLYGIQTDRSTTTTAEARNLPSDDQLWYNLGSGENPQPPEYAQRVEAGLVHGPHQLRVCEPLPAHPDRPVRRLEPPGGRAQVVVLPFGGPGLAAGRGAVHARLRVHLRAEAARQRRHHRQHLHQPVPDVGRPRPHPLQLRQRQRRGLPPRCHPQPRPRVGANGQTRRRRGRRLVPRSHQRHARLLSRAHQRAAAAALAAGLFRLHPGAPEHRQDGEPGLGSQHHHGEPPGHRGRPPLDHRLELHAQPELHRRAGERRGGRHRQPLVHRAADQHRHQPGRAALRRAASGVLRLPVRRYLAARRLGRRPAVRPEAGRYPGPGLERRQRDHRRRSHPARQHVPEAARQHLQPADVAPLRPVVPAPGPAGLHHERRIRLRRHPVVRALQQLERGVLDAHEV